MLGFEQAVFCQVEVEVVRVWGAVGVLLVVLEEVGGGHGDVLGCFVAARLWLLCHGGRHYAGRGRRAGVEWEHGEWLLRRCSSGDGSLLLLLLLLLCSSRQV